MAIKTNKALVVDYNDVDSRSGVFADDTGVQGSPGAFDNPNVMPGSLIDNASSSSFSDSNLDSIFRNQSTEVYEINVPAGTGLAYPLSLKNDSDFPNDNDSTLKHDGFPPMMLFNVVDPIASNPRSKYAIALKVPNSAKVSYNAKWEEIDMGAVVGGIESAVVGQGKFSDVGYAAGARATQNTIDTITGLNPSAAIFKSKRFMINNHAAVMFQGMAFRTFQFSFDIQPKSHKEEREVASIIKAFKYCAHPEGSMGDGSAANSQFFLWPYNFYVNLYGPGLVLVMRSSPCALLSVDVEYVGAGTPAWLINGRPASIILTLTFKELELLTKKRIAQGW